MPWNTLATTDVTDQMTQGEVSALENIQGASTQLQAILTRVTNQAISQILAGGNPIGPTGTIPDSVAQDIIAITRWRWLSSFPALRAFKTEDREKENDSAQKHLSSIAAGKERTEIPANAQTIQAPVNAVGVVRPGVRFRPGGFDKIGST
ncbi:MAG TPA: hypothetical protein VGY56_10690 [Verrucomicrobiae bacterium]|nr:hypothetical protein [Verrucomicrobiae bacterium]